MCKYRGPTVYLLKKSASKLTHTVQTHVVHGSAVFVFVPVSQCFDFSSFVVSFEIRKCETSNFVHYFQSYFGYSESLEILYKIRIILPTILGLKHRLYHICRLFGLVLSS